MFRATDREVAAGLRRPVDISNLTRSELLLAARRDEHRVPGAVTGMTRSFIAAGSAIDAVPEQLGLRFSRIQHREQNGGAVDFWDVHLPIEQDAVRVPLHLGVGLCAGLSRWRWSRERALLAPENPLACIQSAPRGQVGAR